MHLPSPCLRYVALLGICLYAPNGNLTNQKHSFQFLPTFQGTIDLSSACTRCVRGPGMQHFAQLHLLHASKTPILKYLCDKQGRKRSMNRCLTESAVSARATWAKRLPACSELKALQFLEGGGCHRRATRCATVPLGDLRWLESE